MELTKGIRERRSVRKYTKEKVSHEVLEEIVELASFSPSWENKQAVRYIIVENDELIEKLSDPECVFGLAPNARTLGRASAIGLVTFEKGVSGFEKDGSYQTPKGDRWQMFDAGIASQTFCLAAWAKGVGTTIIGYFNEEAIRKIIEIPESQELAAVIPMGYPEKIPQCPPRKSVSELLTVI